MDTIIIAYRRKGRVIWEGYKEIPISSKNAEISDKRERGLICKTFKNLNEYRKYVTKKAISKL